MSAKGWHISFLILVIGFLASLGLFVWSFLSWRQSAIDLQQKIREQEQAQFKRDIENIKLIPAEDLPTVTEGE